MNEETYPFVVRPLPYSGDALGLYINDVTLKYHHGRHYRTYVDKLNGILSDYPSLQAMSLRELLKNVGACPTPAKEAIRVNAGGAYAHEMYFDTLQSPEGQVPEGELKAAMDAAFGPIGEWREQVTKLAVGLLGSGWVWLVTDNRGNVSMRTTANTDIPELKDFTPLLALDVWEHAYYLQYQSRRAAYVENFFRLINWKKVEKRYEAVLQEHKNELIFEDE